MKGLVLGRNMVAWLIVIALVPAAGAMVIEQGSPALMRFAVALVTALIWQGVFFFVRGQIPSPIAGLTALSVALLAPGTLELWQVVLAVSFGTVIGEHVFGGWGRNVVGAGVLSLAFLYFGFPEATQVGTGWLVGAAALLGAAGLIAVGIVSARTLVSAFGALVLGSMALGHDPVQPLLAGSLVFGLVFLVADPVCSGATGAGRWVHGALAGGLTALFGWTDTGIDAPQAVVFAALLAALFAPLIDAAVLAFRFGKWRRGNG